MYAKRVTPAIRANEYLAARVGVRPYYLQSVYDAKIIRVNVFRVPEAKKKNDTHVVKTRFKTRCIHFDLKM